MKLRIVSCLAMVLVTALSGLASGKSTTISVPINQVAAHSGERGQFYILEVNLPEDMAGKRLDSVFLEFAVDVTPLSQEDSVTVTPEVGVFPLTQTYQGGIGRSPGNDTEPEFKTLVPSLRPVAAGETRLVNMDITEIVRTWISNPATNHGLVIGSLTGPAVATVTLKESIPGDSSAVKITFFYQNRFGDRISARQ